jgi:hypothetical protein
MVPAIATLQAGDCNIVSTGSAITGCPRDGSNYLTIFGTNFGKRHHCSGC